MLVSRDFFRRQLELAAYITSVTDLSLGAAIMNYTNIYIRLGLGRDFDNGNPVWVEYVGGLKSNPVMNAIYTYEVWQSRAEVQPPDVIAISGCFSCGYESRNTARIHTDNREDEKASPLSYSQRGMRYAELRELFRLTLTSHPEIENVCGLSWLYNISAYQRLFPTEYIASSKAATGKYRNMPLWGQFLCRNGEVRTDKADFFMKNSVEILHWIISQGVFHFSLWQLKLLLRCFDISSIYSSYHGWCLKPVSCKHGLKITHTHVAALWKNGRVAPDVKRWRCPLPDATALPKITAVVATLRQI